MANLEYATITNTQSIRYDGAGVDRVIAEQSIWLSDKFVSRVFAVLFFIAVVLRVHSDIKRDTAATVNHHKANLRQWPRWITLFFIVCFWGYICAGEK